MTVRENRDRSGIEMPFQDFISEEKLMKSLPPGHKQIHVASFSSTVDLKGRYFQGTVFKRYHLNAVRIPSIKFLLQEDSGSIICFHGFGNIATDLDSCSIGDTILLLDFEVELAPKQSRFSSRFQIIVDDRSHVKPTVWIMKKINSLKQSSSMSSSSKNKTDDQTQNYVYTSLNDLKNNTKVNVYGVITHMRDVTETSSYDKFLLMNITDQSMPDKESILTCNLFNSDTENLPAQALTGDVIRFHRLKIQNYKNKLQARNGPGFHWLLFHGSLDIMSASSPNYTLEKQDKEKVQMLLEWRKSYFSPDASDGQTILDTIESVSSEDEMIISSASSLKDAPPGPSTSKAFESRSPKKIIKSENNKYQPLRDVETGTLADVFGIVIYVKPLVTTKLSQFHLMMNITDQSLRNKDDKLTCNLFHRDQAKLPCEAQVGDVIRLTQLKIQQYRGKKQGNGTVNWALFRESCDHSLTSSDDFKPSPEEKRTVADLRKWWQRVPDSFTLSQCSPRQYFNLVCQVIGIYLEENKSCRVVRVWDGTAFQGNTLKRTDDQMQNEMEKDNALVEIAGNLAADLFLFDNHAEDSSFIKPGDVIKVTNLHANVVNGRIEMTLHGGIIYNKGVAKLEQDNPEAKALLELLKPFVVTQQHSSPGPRNKGRGKRRFEEEPSSHSEASSAPRKYVKKRHEEFMDNCGGGHDDDSQTCNNNNVVELALANEYENISQSAELSQCDRLAVEAYLEKTKTLQTVGSQVAKSTDDAGVSQGAKSAECGDKCLPSNDGESRGSTANAGTSHKRLDKDSDKESTSGSSGEASPSIWLSLYKSPTSDEEQKTSNNQTSRERKTENQQCVKDSSQVAADGVSRSLRSSGAVDGRQQASSKANIPLSPSARRSKSKLSQVSQLSSPIHVDETGNAKKLSANAIVEDKDEETASSQDTFVTASESMSPHKKNVHSQIRGQQLVSSPCKISLKQLSLRQSEIQLSNEKQTDRSRPQESDNTISSSLDSQSKRNDVMGDAESEISSSTDTKSSELSKGSSEIPDQTDDVPLQCLLQTATVVMNHPNVKRSTLKDVQHGKVPHKFKILVRMLDYHPKPALAENLVSFCCPDCNYRLQASEASQSDSLESERTCPNCTEDSPTLKPMIILKFLLSDGKRDLICYLCKSNAVQFLQGIEPLELLSNKECVTEVQHYLDRLCPPNTDFKDKPFMECCIFSYSVKRQILYQIFDTVVA